MYNNNNTSIYPEDMEDSAINPRLSERRAAIKPMSIIPVNTFHCSYCNQINNINACVICSNKVCNLCIDNNICAICLRSDSKQGEIRAYLKKHKRKWCCGW